MLYVHWDEIMSTRFFFRVEAPEEEARRIRALAEEIFEEIRRLESLLSRFLEGSEISRINRLAFGEICPVSPETFHVLHLACDATTITNGFFNVAYLSEPKTPIGQPFTLLKSPLRVRSERKILQIDLGGIGKGFALDHVREIPVRYGYAKILLSADTSTILALDPPENSEGWPLVFEDEPQNDPVSFYLSNQAVSCSGKLVRGEHIFDPFFKESRTFHRKAIVKAPNAALADAFSTAAVMMPPEMLSATPIDVLFVR